jgi:AmiR/NasT family two-component response regulator
MTSRLLQNFKGGRALVVTARGGRESTLETTLAKLGVACEYPEIVGGRAQIEIASLQVERDILFVDGDLEGAVTIEVNPVSRLPPVPVIGLVGVEAPGRLKALVNLGATSFLRKPVHGGAVYTSLFMGINQFLLRSDMYPRGDTRGDSADAGERPRRRERLFPTPPREHARAAEPGTLLRGISEQAGESARHSRPRDQHLAARR